MAEQDDDGVAQRRAVFLANEAVIAQQVARTNQLASELRTSEFELNEIKRKLAIKEADYVRAKTLADENAGVVAAPGIVAAAAATAAALGGNKAAVLAPQAAAPGGGPLGGVAAVAAPAPLAPAPLAPPPLPAPAPLPLGGASSQASPHPFASHRAAPLVTPAAASASSTSQKTAGPTTSTGAKRPYVRLGPAEAMPKLPTAFGGGLYQERSSSDFSDDDDVFDFKSRPSRPPPVNKSSSNWTCNICYTPNPLINHQCSKCKWPKSSSARVDSAVKFDAIHGRGQEGILNDDTWSSNDHDSPSPPRRTSHLGRGVTFEHEDGQDDNMYGPIEEDPQAKKPAKRAKGAKGGATRKGFWESSSDVSSSAVLRDSRSKAKSSVAVSLKPVDAEDEEDEEEVALPKHKGRKQPPLPAWVPIALLDHEEHPVKRVGNGGGWGGTLTHWKYGQGAREIADGKHEATLSQQQEAQQRLSKH
jgi:hypothetical protein